MIPIDDKNKVLDGEWYLCYEWFNQRRKSPVCLGDKVVCIGKYNIDNGHLEGTLWDNDGELQEFSAWMLYDGFVDDDENPIQVQWVFKLTDDEVLKHVVAEAI